MKGKFDSEIIKAVHEVNAILEGKGVFAGSVGLKYHGYLDRVVNDIDVFTEKPWMGSEEAETLLNKESSGTFYVNGKRVERVKGLTSNGILVDYLYKKEKLEYDIVDFYGVEIKLEKPEIAIKAKEDYLLRNSNKVGSAEKHEIDIRRYYARSYYDNLDQRNERSEDPFDDLPF